MPSKQPPNIETPVAAGPPTPPPRARATREAETRVAVARPKITDYKPSQVLTPPDLGEGIRCMWIAEMVNGEFNGNRLQQARVEGFEPVLPEELPPDYRLGVATDNGLVKYGGLILMKINGSVCDQRQAYHERKARESVRSANELQGIQNPHPHFEVEENDAGTRSVVGAAALRAVTGG